MASIADKRRQRDDFLIALYRRVENDRHGTLAMVEEHLLQGDIGITDTEADVISRYLDQGYAKFPVMGRVVSIQPRVSTTPRNSSSSGNRNRKRLRCSFSPSTTRLEAAIQPLREAIDSEAIPLEADELVELNEDLKAIEGQLHSPRPNREIVHGALRSVVGFCRNPVVASVLGAGAWQAIVDVSN